MSIHLLADQGDKSGVAQCIAARANVNEADTTGQKPLHYAAAKGFGEVVALLLQHDADPNSKSDKGITPLHEAAKSGKLETVALLLESKADPTSTDNEHKSPLHYAIAGGHAKVVSRLLEYGADINTAAKDGSTPLHVAASKGSLPLVVLLIEKGAKLDVRDLKGNTALAAVPLADKHVPEVPSSSRKLASDIKSLFINANGKSNDDDDDEDGSEKTFSDITFVVEGQAIHAHKNIVALRCPRLAKMYRNSAGKGKVEVKDISVPSFNALMEWIYSEDVASLRVAEPEVSTILSILMAADRFNLKDLKALSEAIAMRNVGTANLASVWPDVRKCSVAAPELFAYTSHLVASNWNVLATSKMAQDMKPSDIVELFNALKVGEVKEEVQEPVVHKPTHRAHNSPKRSRAQPHAATPATTHAHAPPPETPTRTQPDRAAHRHASTPAPAPTPAPPPVPAGPPPEASLLSLPAELSATHIGNINFWVDQGCKVEGKNLKNIKGILSSMRKHKMAWPFAEPVDPVKLNIPNYREIIKEPMDLGTIQTNLDRDHYQTVNQFAYHMRLVFVNALIFNQPGYDIYKMSESLLKLFNQRFETTPWERSSANGESSSSSYAESLSPVPSSTTPTSSSHSSHSSSSSSSSSSSTSSSGAKQKRKSGTVPAAHSTTSQAPSRVSSSSSSSAPSAGNGHHSSPSPSPPPSPPPVKAERSREHHVPREKAPVPPLPAPVEEDMSYDDKRELGRKMHLLDPNQLSHVIQILGANKSQSDDDIEIDMNDVPIDKLRLLEKYVNSCLEPEQKKPKRRHKEDEEEVVIDDQEDVPSKHEHKHKKKKYREDDD